LSDTFAHNYPHGMKHVSCRHFDSVINYLQNTQPGFLLNTLAEKMDCTPERIRRIRDGKFVLSLIDVDVLKKQYQINPMYLLEGRLPMLLIGDMQIVNEPQAQYGNSLAEENKLLKQTIEDKNRIIELLTAGKPQQDKKRA